jgi:FAD/FMN-containing dehydrogenase
MSGWGRYRRPLCRVARPETVSSIDIEGEPRVIPRGAGRSYGDAATSSEGLVLLTEKLNRQHSFDAATGLLSAEAGTTIEEVLEAFVPRSWFPPVIPGTKFVTLGGAVASDVHGKNHRSAGAFGAHVHELQLIVANGSTVRCSPSENKDLFRATMGGMGLTGIITHVTFQMRPIATPFMVVRHDEAGDLEAALELFEDSKHDDEYTVCWIDSVAKGASLGRGIFIRGHHAARLELSTELAEAGVARRRSQLFTVPIDLPAWVLNPVTARLFNRLYYKRQAGKRDQFVTDFDSFFFPLDAVNHWNRLYGKRGFVQYQCVLPTAEAADGLRELLVASTSSQTPSFLAVLKRFGAEGTGFLSFPITGYSLSLDFPVRPQLFELLRTFDEIVVNRGGRVYLAKDACLKPETFPRMYPRLSEWQEIKQRFDPDHRFCSDLSKRLGMCGELHHPNPNPINT